MSADDAFGTQPSGAALARRSCADDARTLPRRAALGLAASCCALFAFRWAVSVRAEKGQKKSDAKTNAGVDFKENVEGEKENEYG